MDPLLALRKAHRWLWALILVAILLVGALSNELAAKSSPATGVAVAVVATLLALVVTQICRLMLAIGKVTSKRRISPSQWLPLSLLRNSRRNLG